MSKHSSSTQSKRKKGELFTFRHGDILDAINDNFFLMTGQQITRYLYPKDRNGDYTRTLGNSSTIRSRLAYLTRQKYLHAHHLPTDENQRPFVYHLARRGKQYEEEQDREVLIYWEKEEIESRSPGWKTHLLSLNDVLISIRLLPLFDPTLTIASVTHDLLLKRKPYEYLDASGACFTLQPDAVIELHQEREGRNRLRTIIFIEMDRGTRANDKWRNHLTHLYNYVAKGYAEADFGTSNMVVLFPTTAGQKRVEQMRQLARLEFGEEVEETQRKNRLFLFAAVPKLQELQTISPLEIYESPIWYTAFGHDRKVQIIGTPA